MSEDELRIELDRIGALSVASISLAGVAIAALKTQGAIPDEVLTLLHENLEIAAGHLREGDPARETIEKCRAVLDMPQVD